MTVNLITDDHIYVGIKFKAKESKFPFSRSVENDCRNIVARARNVDFLSCSLCRDKEKLLARPWRRDDLD